jgi:hypothetical protein
MTATTRLASTHAADWRDFAACVGTDTESFFDDAVDTQKRTQDVCRGCPVRVACVSDVTRYEAGGQMRWGVAGGLTPIQRRALRVEALLGNRPNLKQAARLAGPGWAAVLSGMQHLPPARVSRDLRQRGQLVTAVTVRVALWWVGGKGSVVSPKKPGDQRRLWEYVRDESRPVVAQLRAMDVGNRDVAAYLGVSEDALARAVTGWNAQDAQAVKAA